MSIEHRGESESFDANGATAADLRSGDHGYTPQAPARTRVRSHE